MRVDKLAVLGQLDPLVGIGNRGVLNISKEIHQGEVTIRNGKTDIVFEPSMYVVWMYYRGMKSDLVRVVPIRGNHYTVSIQ